MHDHVIGRLVGTGMAVQGLARSIVDSAGHRRLAAHIDDLDAAVRDLRTLIYGLDQDPAVVWSLPARVLQVVDEATPHLGFAPSLDIDAGLDLPAGSAVPEHLLGVLREALANVARHAGAAGVHITVARSGDRVGLTVADDGRGPPKRRRVPTASGGHGLANMAERATSLGGDLRARDEPGRRRDPALGRTDHVGRALRQPGRSPDCGEGPHPGSARTRKVEECAKPRTASRPPGPVSPWCWSRTMPASGNSSSP